MNTSCYQEEMVAGNNGDENTPFLIHDEKSLAALVFETNINISHSFKGMHILLMSNLDLSGTSHVWTPIWNTTESQNTKFTGNGTF